METRVLNQAIKRNLENFPEDFMFKLNKQEWLGMSSQIVMTYPIKRPLAHSPYSFTEHGVTMLASILKSPIARKMNIAVVRKDAIENLLDEKANNQNWQDRERTGFKRAKTN